MTDSAFWLNRRGLLAGLGGTILNTNLPALAAPVSRQAVTLLAQPGAVAPGGEPKDAAALYTVNGRPAPDISIRSNDRLRLRIINGCHRNVIALKIEDHAVLVMAIDGQPAEPFLARDGRLVLAPGNRID